MADVDFFRVDRTNYQPNLLLEGMKSWIWTERYNDHGEFQFEFPRNNDRIKGLLSAETVNTTLIGKSDSEHIMMLETVEDRYNDGVIVAKGRSADVILKARVAIRLGTGEGPDFLRKNLVITSTPIGVAINLVRDAIISGYSIYSSWALPNVGVVDTTGKPGGTDDHRIEPQLTYDIVKKMCDSVNCGWKFQRYLNGTSADFKFYKGADRSNNVVFSPELENMSGVTHLISLADYYNSGTIWTNENLVYHFASPYVKRYNGWGVRSKITDGSSINSLDYGGQTGGYEMAVANLFYEDMSQTKPQDVLDGTIIPRENTYEYNKDYFLGDIVNVMYEGETWKRRVTEHISSWDAEGHKEYPTLAALDAP